MNLLCTLCNQKSINVRNYLSHYRLHRNVKNLVYNCCYEHCNGKFTRFTSLKSHISRSHTSISAFYFPEDKFTDYMCTVQTCQKKIKGRKELLAHMKSHIPEQPISCPFKECKGFFSVKSSFTSHVSRKHGLHDKLSNNFTDNVISDRQEENPGIEQDYFEMDNDNVPNEGLNENLCSEEQFSKSLGLALLKFETVNLIPVSTLDEFVSNISFLHTLSQSNLKNDLKQSLTKICKSNSSLEQVLHSVFDQNYLTRCLSTSAEVRFTSNFKRLAFYKDRFGLIEPIEINLGLNENNQYSFYQYIPLKKTLGSLLTNSNINQQFDQPLNSDDPNLYSDIQDGESFKKNEYFIENPTSLKLVLYQDAFEIVNPLGSAKKTFKLVGFYFTVADLYPQFRSKIDHLQLALLCRESDLEYFGVKKVIDPLIRDIKELSSGVFVENGKFIKANLVCVLGDNLGSHWIGGFTTSFGNAEYLCRYCLITKSSFSSYPSFQAPLRCKATYTDTLRHLNENNILHHNGIKHNSVLHEIPGFHVCNPGMPPCLGHDLFEGVVKYDLALFLKELVTKYKWFDVQTLNSRIKHVSLAGNEASNRPAKLANDLKYLKGHAVQNWMFLRLLPIYIEDKILDPQNIIWTTILLLRELIEYICAYKISANQIAVLQSLIFEYIEKRKELFPHIPLRPKHHYLMHYPWLICQFGPLLHVWTMRFESKHTFFKRCIRNFKNFINVTKTLALKHQLLQTYCSNGNMFNLEDSFENITMFDSSMFSEDIQRVIKETVKDWNQIQVTSHFISSGIKVKTGCVFLLRILQGVITFGVVEICIVFKGEPYIICKQYSSYRSELGLYNLNDHKKSELCMLKYKSILDNFPLVPYNIRNMQLIPLKHQPYNAMDY